MTELEERVAKAQEAYYNGNPIMSDVEFDELWDQLPADSELKQEVGADHTDGFLKAEHVMLMGSQNKANTAEEMDRFFKKGHSYLAQVKCDGISVEIQYEHGKFIRCVSRGDGRVGDDLGLNSTRFQGIPATIDPSFTGAIRGEILLFKSVKAKHFPDAKNCRNMASGIAKRKDGEGCEKLNIVCYDAYSTDGKRNWSTETQLQSYLASNGFQVAPYVLRSDWTGAEAIAHIASIWGNLDAIDFDIDGVVFKQNDIDWQDKSTSYRPKTQIALKPKRDTARSILRSVEWRLTNGTFTPVAHFDPVQLNGTTVEAASLANLAQIEELGLDIGHEIVVVKCSMIIPKIIKNITTGKFLEGYCDS